MRLTLSLKVPPLDVSDLRFKKLKTNLTKNYPRHVQLPPDKLSIPLLQLGDMGKGTFMGLYQQLKELTQDFEPFSLKLNGLWASPHQEEASMLWIGVQNSRELRSLQQMIINFLALDEGDITRPHIPFIYLEHKSHVSDLISPFKNFDFGEVVIEEVALVEKLTGKQMSRVMGRYHLGETKS